MLTIGSCICVVVAIISTIQEVVRMMIGHCHPLRWIRRIHASLIPNLATIAAMVGLLHAMWSSIVYPKIYALLRDFVEGMMIDARSPSTQTKYGLVDKPFHFPSPNVHILCVGFLRGLIVGVGLGMTWRAVFGDMQQPSIATMYLNRYVWKPLKRYYRVSATKKKGTIESSEEDATAASFYPSTFVPPSLPSSPGRHGCFQKQSTKPCHGRSLTVSSSLPDEVTTTAKSTASSLINEMSKCAICLEPLSDLREFSISKINKTESLLYGTDDEDGYDKFEEAADRYQLLPCGHSTFHRDCACEWLAINKSCPVCRVPVQAILGCT
jgi:Ring finger domain